MKLIIRDSKQLLNHSDLPPLMEGEKRTIITGLVAHVDHGKTTLIDSLIASQGVISKSSAGMLRYLDTRADEQKRGITLKLSLITLKHRNTHIVIDTPGHVDFESLVQVCSFFADNFLILIDVNEGVTPRTYSLVNYVGNKPSVLIINKIDKIVDLEEDEICEKISSVIYRINSLVADGPFKWEANNVIIACSTLCYGINFVGFGDILKGDNKRNSLGIAVKFIKTLYQRIKDNETEKIMERY
jgi:elongation factor 2/ribosome assembly protein 1